MAEATSHTEDRASRLSPVGEAFRSLSPLGGDAFPRGWRRASWLKPLPTTKQQREDHPRNSRHPLGFCGRGLQALVPSWGRCLCRDVPKGNAPRVDKRLKPLTTTKQQREDHPRNSRHPLGFCGRGLSAFQQRSSNAKPAEETRAGHSVFVRETATRSNS